VRNNYFTKCDGENEMISNKSTGNRYLHNTFIDNKGELTLRHGDEAWIEGNFFDDPSDVGAPGIRVIGSRHVIVNNYLKRLRFAFNVYNGEDNPQPTGYTQVKDVIIAFNTVEDCQEEFRLGTTNRPMPPVNLRIFYNLVKSTGDTILNYSNKSTDVRYKGNIMYGGDPGRTDSGIREKRPMLADDKLKRLATDVNKLFLKADRKVIPGLAVDINGTPRPDACNIGAIESPGGKPLFLCPHKM
jgi:poly(beta-D-mannuronate) lyase